MIIDVHARTPTCRDAVPEDRVLNSVWRPDRAGHFPATTAEEAIGASIRRDAPAPLGLE